MIGCPAVRHVVVLSHKQERGIVTFHPVILWEVQVKRLKIVAQMMRVQVLI